MSGGKKPPTAAELNERAKRFWKAQNENLQDLLETHPQLVTAAAIRAAEDVAAGHISDPVYAKRTSVVLDLPDAAQLLEQSHKALQRKHARKKGRSQAHNPRRDVIAAMAKACRQGEELSEFLQTAANDGIETLTIKFENSKTKNTYRVECEGFEATKTVTYRTLQMWWKAAKSI